MPKSALHKAVGAADGQQISVLPVNQETNINTHVEYQVVRSRIPFLKHCYVVVAADDAETLSATQQVELLDAALQVAREKSQAVFGNPESFTIIHSGRGSRRVQSYHVHVAILNARWKKAWFYFVLSAKNVLQALRIRRDRRR